VRALPIDTELPAIVTTLRGVAKARPRGAARRGEDHTRASRAPRRGFRRRDRGARASAPRGSPRCGSCGRRARREVGERVGYSVRFEESRSERTRIRFVTEGVLTRRLVTDPKLAGVGVVILDEFHERNLQGGRGPRPARARPPDRARRPPRDRDVGHARRGTGRRVPRCGEDPLRGPRIPRRHRARATGGTIGRSSSASSRPHEAPSWPPPDGDTLVFLPGAREIRKCSEALQKLASEHGVDVVALHGELPLEEQSRAIRRGAAPERSCSRPTWPSRASRWRAWSR
jgi:ATP-dependent helicase HrpB